MSTYNLCFDQIYEKYQCFLSEIFQFFEVKFSICLNRCVFVMGIHFLPKMDSKNVVSLYDHDHIFHGLITLPLFMSSLALRMACK